MSSSYVRTQIASFIAANLPTENLIDLSAEYETLQQVLSDNSLTYKDPWLGLQYIGDDETPITVGADNDTGKYREFGGVYLHVTAMSTSTAVNSILTRAEAIRDTFRGQRINDIVITSVTPPNFSRGATLEFDGGFTSAAIVITYERDLDL